MNRLIEALGAPGELGCLCQHTYLANLLSADSTVLDFGANRGQFSFGIIQRHGCRVFALEPVSALREKIDSSPLLTLMALAAGGRSGKAGIRIFNSRCASLLEEKESEIVKAEEEVEVADFCEILRRVGTGRVDLLKVDIEGAELEMFASASDEDLLRCAQITVEFHDFIYPEQRAQVEATKRRLQSIGFMAINFRRDNSDVLFFNPATTGIGPLHYYRLKYIAKFARGIARRMSKPGRPFREDTK
jgi:FkbM family methyltransferase